MNPFEVDIIRVSDPLTPQTRGVRKSLLLSSVIAIAVAKTGFIPTKISALGLEFSEADRGSMLWLIGAVVVFFLLSFLVSAASDLMAWEMSQRAREWDTDRIGYENLFKSIVEKKRMSAEELRELHEEDMRAGAMWRGSGQLDCYVRVQRFAKPISWARIFVEFFLPVGVAGYGLFLVIRATV